MVPCINFWGVGTPGTNKTFAHSPLRCGTALSARAFGQQQPRSAMLYTGAMEKGQMHGKGALVYPNSEKYEVRVPRCPTVPPGQPV